MATSTNSLGELSAELAAKIAQARDLPSRPHAQPFATPATVAETVHRQVHARPEQDFLIYYDENGHRRTRTYLCFYARMRLIAKMMRECLGLQHGDRIVTAMHNDDRTILITFAAWHLGLVVVPLNMSEDEKRLGYVVQHSGAKAIFVFSEYTERMRPLIATAPALRHAMVVGRNFSQSEFMSFEREVSALRLEEGELEVGPQGVDPRDEALIVYTSGTTGTPKGVVLTQYNLIADAHAIAKWHELKPGEKMMCVLPVHHVNGLVVTHVTPVFAGASVVLNRKFSVSAFFPRIAAEGVRIVSVVPTLLHFLLDSVPKEIDRKFVPTLSHIICGAGPLTVDLAAKFEDRFGIPICHGYGLSETVCYSCFVPIPSQTNETVHGVWMRFYGYPSIGIPVETNEMAIHDEQGNPLPESQKGEIVVRGHNVMKGYAHNPQANESAFTHAWFRTGDEGFWKLSEDKRPYFFISGRFKELIVRGGVKISPLEVDEALNKIPGVKGALCVGFENAAFGEEVGAFVVKQPGVELTEAQFLDAARKALAPHAAPKVVVFGDTLPVTSTGKPQRNLLKPLFEAHKNTQFKC